MSEFFFFLYILHQPCFIPFEFRRSLHLCVSTFTDCQSRHNLSLLPNSPLSSPTVCVGFLWVALLSMLTSDGPCYVVIIQLCCEERLQLGLYHLQVLLMRRFQFILHFTPVVSQQTDAASSVHCVIKVPLIAKSSKGR